MKNKKKYLLGVALSIFVFGCAVANSAEAKTKIIEDNSTGGDCEEIGVWDFGSKTCSLGMDLDDGVEIEDDGIIFDGDGYVISSNSDYFGYGISVSNAVNVEVRNVSVEKFHMGINFYNSDNFYLHDSSFSDNNFGLMVNNSSDGFVWENSSGGNHIGSLFMSASNNKISNNNFSNNIRRNSISYAGTGIYMEKSDYNIFENNISDNNEIIGLTMISSYGNKFYSSSFSQNGAYGVSLSGYSSIENEFSGSSIEENQGLDVNIYNMACKNNFSKATFSGDKPLLLVTETERIDGGEYSEVILCGVHDVELNDINIGGSENIKNNGLLIINSYGVKIDNVTSSSNSYGAYFSYSNYNEITNSYFEGNDIAGIYLSYASGNSISKNNISNNFQSLYSYRSIANDIFNNNFIDNINSIYNYRSYNSFEEDPPIGGNYWNDYDSEEEGCIDENSDGFCDSPYYFMGDSDSYPLKEKIKLGEPEGYSSVAFLPGVQASRLYKKHLLDEDRLWEPTNRNEDIKDLYLDENGSSVDQNIYTRDITDSIYGFGIYGDFSAYMDSLVDEETIAVWRALPYDWRLPLSSTVDDGIRLEGGELSDLLEEIEELAQNSDTGKVTLIGHSNGGLVGKLLIDRLENIGKADLIDKFIMVGTPQLGTPKAIAGILHGDGLNMGGGLLIDKKTARGLAENMSSAYNLLPSEKYFNYVETPVIEFDEDVKEIYDFREIYGENIDNYEEFIKFLKGDDGERSDPEFSDTDSPNVLSDNLLSQSREVHSSLDNWQAPESMEVIQIAGWGLDTIAGIKYDDCDIPFCPDKLSNLDRELVFKEDGDKTVVIPSAINMIEAEKYYVDIFHNNENPNNKNGEHANILEITSVREFISNIIQGNRNLPEYILEESPISEDEDKRLRYSMHSPVKVDLYDNAGNHTGIIENSDPDSDLVFYEEEIPNSYYLEFGETKYLGSDGKFVTNVDLTGEDLGTFTFEIDEIYGSGEVESTVFPDIPVMKGMKASLEIVDDVGIMEIDIEGDGIVDFEIESGEEQDEIMSLDILERILENLEIHKTTKDRLINKLDNAKKQIEKENIISADAMLDNLIHQIEVFSRDETVEKFRIPEDDAEKIVSIIEIIRKNLIK